MIMWYMLSVGYLSPFFTAIGHLLILNNQSSVESIVHVGDIMLMEWLCWFSGLVQQRVWLTYKISGLPFGMLVLCHVCDILKVYIERGRLAFVSSGIPSDIVLQTLISFYIHLLSYTLGESTHHEITVHSVNIVQYHIVETIYVFKSLYVLMLLNWIYCMYPYYKIHELLYLMIRL